MTLFNKYILNKKQFSNQNNLVKKYILANANILNPWVHSKIKFLQQQKKGKHAYEDEMESRGGTRSVILTILPWNIIFLHHYFSNSELVNNWETREKQHDLAPWDFSLFQNLKIRVSPNAEQRIIIISHKIIQLEICERLRR